MTIFMNEIDEKKDSLLKLDLQFFAQDDNPGADKPGHDVHDGDNGGVNPGAEPDPYAGEGDDKTNKKSNKKEKLFTQEEVNRIVKERLARALKDKEEAIKEAEKLAKMNAEQKREYELEKLRRENEELKKAQMRYELGREATKMLGEAGIMADDDVLSFVVRDNAEQTQEAVETFISIVDKLADMRMKEKLKGRPPKKDGQPGGFKNPFSKEHFNLTEQARLLKTDPELYKRLKAQAKNQ